MLVVTAAQAKIAADHAFLAAVHPREYALWRKYRDRSMVNRRRFIDNVVLARGLRNVDGAIVECGSWHCGMVAAISEVLPGRSVYDARQLPGTS